MDRDYNTGEKHAFGADLWVSRVRVLEHGVLWRLYSCTRETLKYQATRRDYWVLLGLRRSLVQDRTHFGQ